MDTAQDKLAFQVQFWGLIGPFIALITSFVILIKSPPEAIYLSIATIVGLIVSSKWKIKGALFSIGLMLLFYLYHFSEIDPNEHLWHIGMNLSIILGFAITAFSLQEVEELLHFGEKSILAEDAAIKEETAIKTDELTSYAALVETMRKEKILATRQHENLLQEFMNKQKELSHIQESLHAARQEIEELGKKPVEDLAALQLKEKEVELLKNELEALKAQKELPIKEVSNIDADAFFELKSTNELLSRERGRLESLLFRTQIDLHQKTEDLKNFPQLETEVEDLKAKLQELEKELAEETHKKEALFADLEEKEKLLNPQLETEVEDLKAKLQELEKELAEETHKKEALFADLEEKEKLLNQEIEAKQTLEKEFQERAAKIKEQEVIDPSLISPEKLPFELKKIEGRYRQLRQQFELKSDVLDETRKELFYKEEGLLEAKLYLNELQLYHFSDAEAAMQGYLLAVIEESNQKIQALEKEIEEL